mgnify:CR=1 FL=1
MAVRTLLDDPAARGVWEWLGERYPRQRLTPDTSPRQTGALARHNLFVWPLGWLIRSLGAVPVETDASTATMPETARVLRLAF